MMNGGGNASFLDSARSAVLKASESLEGVCQKIEGYDFNKGVDYQDLLKSMVSTGFQASNLGDAIDVVNQMVCLDSFFFFFVSFLHDNICIQLILEPPVQPPLMAF